MLTAKELFGDKDTSAWLRETIRNELCVHQRNHPQHCIEHTRDIFDVLNDVEKLRVALHKEIEERAKLIPVSNRYGRFLENK